MWTSLIRNGIALGFIVFLMQVVVWVVGPILTMANSGPNADHASVERTGAMFSLVTLDNLVLLGGLAVAIALIGRAVVERRGI